MTKLELYINKNDTITEILEEKKNNNDTFCTCLINNDYMVIIPKELLTDTYNKI